MKRALKKQSIIPRLDGIMRDTERLKELGEKPLEAFKADENNFYLAQFHLRQALEGVFHIGEHILSRLNGGRATEYKEIARKLGEYKIVDRDFADSRLVEMAGYRNRLTHFYAEITQDEMYEIIKNSLGDFSVFIQSIKKVIENPEKFNLALE